MDIAGWEGLYRSGERGAEDKPTTLLVETAAKLATGTAIDLACGTGRNALHLAEQGWTVTAVDASETAIQILRRRAAERGLQVKAEVGDLTEPGFALPQVLDLVVIAYYLQRDLLTLVKQNLRPGGVVLAIAHTPEKGEQPNYKRAAPGELRDIFSDWEILHAYEGPSRDPAHRRPVAEIVARLPVHLKR